MAKSIAVDQVIYRYVTQEQADTIKGVIQQQFGFDVKIEMVASGVYQVVQPAGTRMMNIPGFSNMVLCASAAVAAYNYLKEQGKVR